MFAITEVPVFLLILPAANFMKRRHGTLFFLSVSCICCLGIVGVNTLDTDEYSKGTSIKILAMIGRLSAQGLAQMLSLFSAELFPTVLRTLQANFMSLFFSISLVVAPFLVPTDDYSMTVCYAVMALLLVLCGLLCVTLPETKGKPLSDHIES